ncbi:MAG: acyltransferase [Syntrophobacteraceae bacterium]|jgi:peptidoglycan/LPS O-acetylase OafA/YrhL|nr:acyltransferase [Syntrophobacteraceae bacterium]
MGAREEIDAACRIPAPGPRLFWLDIMKGVSILWIVIFHFLGAYDPGRYPWPVTLSNLVPFARDAGGGSPLGFAASLLEGILVGLIQRGPQPVGVFIVLSGFGLTYSLTKTGHPEDGWRGWYQKRLVRLFPLYWVAHAIVIFSPLAYRSDPLDHRLILSLLGQRSYPAETVFYYLVPAWWFVGLLVQLYLVFPVLFRLMNRLGPVWFFTGCVVFTLITRYVLYAILEASGNYVQGAFFGGRLWEFSAGMVLAYLYRKHPAAVEDGFFSRGNLLFGAVLHVAGIASYQPNFLCIFSDGLVAMGLFILMAQAVRGAACILPASGSVLTTVGVYSYGLYLLHQPYVITFGKLLSHQGFWAFLLYAAVIMGAITLLSLFVEKLVNRLTARILERPRTASLAP